MKTQDNNIFFYFLIVLFFCFIHICSYAQTGPGGVGNSTTNKLWLRANDINGLNDGDAITIWADTSGNDFDASQSTAGYRPIYETGEISGMPVVRLDGNDDYFDDNRSYTARTSFIVYKVSSTLQAGSELGQPWGSYGEGVHIAMDARAGNLRGWSFDGNGANQGKYSINSAAYGAFAEDNNTSQWTYDESQIVVAEFNADRSITRQVIGSLVPAYAVGAHQFGGDIAEIIVYNTTLNDAQKIIIENYLSAKYNITLDQNDKYSYQGTHKYDVVGIGRVDVSNEHAESESSEMFTISTPSDLGNDEYLFFGHDNGSIGSWTTTETPNSGSNTKRIAREWRLDETGDIGTVTIKLDTTLLPARPSEYSHFVVWVDSDGDFGSGATAYVLTQVGATEIFQKTGMVISDGDYITFGCIRSVVQYTSTNSSASEPTSPANIEVHLNYALSTDITVDYSVTGGTAIGSGTDYTLADGTATITAGNTTTNISATIVNDIDVESGETIIIDILNPASGVYLGTNTTHTYTINDDDNPRKINFTASNSNGDEGTTPVTLTIQIDLVDNTNPTTVDYTVTGGTATGSGTDYTLADGTATITSGNTTTTFNITIINGGF